jgi:recombination protein RecT
MTPPPTARSGGMVRTTVDTTRMLLEKSRGQLQMALPRHLSVDRLIRIAMTSIQRTPRLMECTPLSLLGAVMQCAQLGLEPDGVTGMAFLVPYWNSKKNSYEAQFQPGYRGLMDLAYRSEQVLKFDGHAVFERDRFHYEYGLRPALDHQPHRGEDRGELTAAYGVAQLRDTAEPLFRVVERHEIDKTRARSKSKDEGPWVTDFDTMAVKTAMRRLCKMVRQTPELRRAVALDELAEAQLPQGLELLSGGDVVDAEVVTPPGPAAPVHSDQAAPAAPPTATIVESQQKRLLAMMKGHHTEAELYAHLQTEYHIDQLARILKSDYDTILQWATH